MAENLPPGFPEAILHAVDQRDRSNNNKKGSTCNQIMKHLRRRLQPVPAYRVVQSMLSKLRKTRELETGRGGSRGQHHYTLCNAQPRLPPWFDRAHVLQAVQQLDGQNGNRDGSHWRQIKDSLLQVVQEQEQQQLPPRFDNVLQGFLSLLRERGDLHRGDRSSQHYTVPDPVPAPAPAPEDMPEFHWGYYLGFHLGWRAGSRSSDS